jgi:hypothetical protein
MPDNFDNLFLRFGGAKKSTFDMSKEELKQVSSEILLKAKEKPFPKAYQFSLVETNGIGKTTSSYSVVLTSTPIVNKSLLFRNSCTLINKIVV